jgi:hypothetical protein
MAILTCPGCGRGGLRVPDGRRGTVTCPTCKAEWFYPESVEVSEVEFRCSGSGARFIVVLSRRSPLHQFVIQAIKHAPSRQPTPGAQEDAPASEAVGQVSSAHALPPARIIGWLARITGAKAPTTANSAVPQSASRSPAPSVPASYEAKHYNWSSFLCPYCDADSFVKCTGGHLTCDGTAQVRHGKRFHECFCGKAGFISGAIEAFECNTMEIPIASDHMKPPSPQQGDEGDGKGSLVSLPSTPMTPTSRSR